MNIELPEPIENYLRYRAEGAHHEAAAAFAAEATVVDAGEDTEVVGRDAIYRWMIEVANKYTTTVEVVNLLEEDGEVILTTFVSGNFAGSPAEFEYRFALREGLIERMVIEFICFK